MGNRTGLCNRYLIGSLLRKIYSHWPGEGSYAEVVGKSGCIDAILPIEFRGTMLLLLLYDTTGRLYLFLVLQVIKLLFTQLLVRIRLGD